MHNDDAVFHPGLLTFVSRIEYDFAKRWGKIWAYGPVCMSGSISLFTMIDHRVELILAYMDGKPDVCYRKKNRDWEVGNLRSIPADEGFPEMISRLAAERGLS